MVSRLTVACGAGLVLLSVATLARTQENPYRLKEPDQKKLCLECHTDFDEKLKQAFVHTPVQTGDCSACHDPHVSSHGKLLAEETGRMCARCHDGIIPANAKSAHKVVADGQCDTCHDPHASAHAANLRAKGSDLCFGCHPALGETIGQAKFKHSPVQQGCETCHDAHGSDRSVGLLKDEVPALCVTCHDPDSQAFQSRHMQYPVARASCTSCHDPHGSDRAALLPNAVHAPLTDGTCAQCHDGPGSDTPFATKRIGFELCKGCHADLVNTTMARTRLHWPVADRTGCANCHNPHASRHDALLKSNTAQLCGDCHADTLKRIASMPVKHQPVDSGTCGACHAAHGTDAPYLLNQPSINALCTTCHDYETHSAHPIGEKTIDPRNKNLRVDCLSCHRAHGTEFKWMLTAPSTLELCTQCHTRFTR